jgi:hypothetical protein
LSDTERLRYLSAEALTTACAGWGTPPLTGEERCLPDGCAGATSSTDVTSPTPSPTCQCNTTNVHRNDHHFKGSVFVSLWCLQALRVAAVFLIYSEAYSSPCPSCPSVTSIARWCRSYSPWYHSFLAYKLAVDVVLVREIFAGEEKLVQAFDAFLAQSGGVGHGHDGIPLRMNFWSLVSLRFFPYLFLLRSTHPT